MMKFICIPVLFLLLSLNVYSQKNIIGVWQGYFVQQVYNPFTQRFSEDKYKFEVQINQLPNNALEGVTYSYKTTVFYGKAAFHGIYNKTTKNVLVKELKMLDLKVSDQSVPCLMTCYLDYAKNGNDETLTGNYTSVNANAKTDCGDGTVYLKKVPESDFKKEDFLLKKNNSTSITKKIVPQTTTKSPSSVVNKTKPTIKPNAEEFVVHKPSTIKQDTVIKQKIIVPEKKIEPKIIPVPEILKERKNSLISTIDIAETDVQIDFYDNGEIDDDSITVYHNNELVINHRRLSYTPITIHLKLSEENATHEIVTVADNLGTTPPNTALMVITTSKMRKEVFITSDEKTNAKVIIQYKPKETSVKRVN